MVRVKHRYILFEILYPPGASNNKSHSDAEEVTQFTSSERNALLTLHRASPANINHKTILHAIRKSLQEYYGDFGAGSAGMLMTLKYFSNKTSTGLIRCGRAQFETIVAAMSLISRLEDQNIAFSCVHVSGTIKKCEEFSIKKSTEMIRRMDGPKGKRLTI
ncbi:POP5 [Candida margitis]|uniref:POP5 n=1 Tax=Candida margitis TaxID=1775924 RepID=UPI002226F10C|nr:POP5 [Candida margitis]KAI5950188.1 POP5 [Candida margitis]